jgi:hypothetical protein
MKKLLVVSAVTLAMISQAIVPASAVPYYPPPPPHKMVVPGAPGGSTPWVPICIFGGAAGLILAAIVVGRTQNRELTQAEALGTAFTCGLGALFVGYRQPVVAAPAPVRTKN